MKKENTDEVLMLYIPIGISTRLDYFPGFGKVELMQSLVGVFIGGIIALIVFIITNQVLPVMITLIISVGGSILATTKSSLNQSMVSLINDIIKFNRARKSYPYRQVKEWE